MYLNIVLFFLADLLTDFTYLVTERKLDIDWVLANCTSADETEASELLGYTAKSPCIVFRSAGLEQLQLRPLTPWASKDGKEPKYRTPKGEYDAFLAKHPKIKEFWTDLEILKARCFSINGKPYLLITEGCIKAITGCQHGIPTVGLMGVTMSLTPKAKGKPDLVPVLKRLTEAGFNFIFAYDSDEKPETVKNVRYHEAKLTKVLKAYDCDVLSVTGKWNHKDGKGMDDFIQNKGIEAFRAILMKAESVDTQSHDTSGSKKGKQLPPPSEIAAEIAETYRDKLAWESEYQLWRRYSAKHDGVWGVETTESIKGLTQAHLRSQQKLGFSAGYVSSIATILQSDLEVLDWNEQTGLIPLQDGVLDIKTQQLLPHKPGYRFTYRIPLKWSDRAIGCKPIEEFLRRIAGSQAVANVLLAWLSAVVTRRSDLQRYLELVGGGGTGKSTYMALNRALAGAENTVSSQLKHLESNQFETAKFYGKILGLFPDSEKWQGEVSVLKQLTGADPVRYERKGVQQCRDFIFKGMVMLSANEAPESKDKTSGLERRKLTIPLENRIAEYVGRDLMEEFKPYLAGLLKRVLDIPRDEVTRLIKHTEREVPELATKKWEQMYQTNDIARWLDDKAILDPDLLTYVGTNDESKAGSWLYASYCLDRTSQNEKPISMKSFRPNLMDLLKNQLKASVETGEDKKGRYIKGIALRCMVDPTGQYYPRPVTQKPFGDGGWMADGGELVVAESIGSGGLDGCGGLNENCKNTENSQIEIPLGSPQNSLRGRDNGNNPPQPSNPPLPGVPATTDSQQATPNPPPQSLNPSHYQTAANKNRAEKWADEVREARAKGSREDEERIMKQVAESSLQLRGFFKRSLGEKKDDTQPVLKHPRIFEVGDRVVINDVGGRYHGVRGVIVEIRPTPYRTNLLVKFDKPVSFCEQLEFIAGDLMYLPEK